MATAESEEVPMLMVETEEEQKLEEARQACRPLVSARSAILAFPLLGALAAGVTMSRHALPGMLGGQVLLGEYDQQGGVPPWRKLAGQLKGTASRYGVDMDVKKAEDPILRNMMDTSDMTSIIGEGPYSRIRELMSETLETAKRHAKEHGLDMPAPRRGRLDASGALKRLEHRRKRAEERRLEAVARAIPLRSKSKEEKGQLDQISIAQCVLSSNAALVSIADAGLALNAMLAVCRNNTINNTDFDPLDCGSNVADFIGQIAGLASFVATIPSFCGIYEDLRAVCASDVSLFVSTASTVAADGIAIKQDCPGDVAPRPVWGIHGGANQPRQGFPQRRLREAPLRDLQQMTRAEQVENDQGLASCFFFAYAAAHDIPATAIDIWTTQLDCHDADGEDEKAACVADIITCIADVTQLLSDAASAAANCPVELPPRAACIGDAASITVQALSFGAWGAVIKQDCVDLNTTALPIAVPAAKGVR